MRKNILKFSFIICLFVFCLICCNEIKENKIRIGVILPLTGPGALYGEQVLEGINLALENLIEQKLLKKDEFKLFIEDSKTEPIQGVNALKKLINVKKIMFVIGPLASSVTLACAPIAEKEKCLILSPGSSNDKISSAGDYIFRIAPTDSYDGKFLANVIFKRYKIKKSAILYLNNDFGIGLAKRFNEVYMGLHGEISAMENFLEEDVDFRTPILKISKTKPDAILLIASTNKNILALRQMRELGINSKIFAPSTLNDPDLIKKAGEVAEGVIFSAAGFEGIKNHQSVKKFIISFRNKYSKQPTSFSAYGYDSLIIIANNIKRIGYNSTKVKEELYKMPTFFGASGSTKFDKNGDAEKELSLFKVKGGKIFSVIGNSKENE